MALQSDLSGLRVAVTGAGGFIGRALVAALCAQRAKVTAILRSRHGADRLRAMGAQVAIAPLTPGPGLQKALTGNDVLFHFAYDLRAGGVENLAAFDATLAAAAACNIRRIVHASSVVVYDDWPGGSLTEASPMSSRTGGPYRQAKIAMEQRLMASAFEVAILQPTIVWGPGSPQWTLGPITALKSGGVILPDPPGLCPALHIDDLVQAALLAATAPDLIRDRFLINGPDTPTWADLFQGYANLVGGTVTLEPHTSLLARIGAPPPPGPDHGPSAAAKISARLRRIVGHQRFEAAMARLHTSKPATGPASPDPWSLILYSARPSIPATHARTRLGYAPQITLNAGLAALAASI